METSQTAAQTAIQSSAQVVEALTFDTYGTNEEGNWNVYTCNSNAHGVSWGPFPTRTKAIEFMTEVGNTNMFAVNDSDLPNFHNV